MRTDLRTRLSHLTTRTKSAAAVAAFALVVSTVGLLAGSATAGTAPWVRALSRHSAAYWGGTSVTVDGANFTGVTAVKFGSTRAWSVRVLSPTRLVAVAPYHGRGTVNVRVSTRTGTSSKNSATGFTFRRPTMNDKIQGGLTGKQEQRISKQVRAKHHTPSTARRSARWTSAMGVTAARRATSWIGLPYSWAGGNSRGPTKGVCAGDGGDLDCKIVGFDCSGLTLYSWAPYKAMAHYAATQRSRAGRFHPAVGELVPGDLVFFSGYIPGGVGHVAIYVGNGYVVQAAQSGSTVSRDRLVDVIASHGTYRGATRPTSTGRQGAVPSVSGVTSTVRTSGGLLAITGRNLAGVTSVSFSGKRVYTMSRSASRLVVRAPAHRAGKGSVSVSNAWGTATRSTTYVAPPVTTALSPASGPVYGGNTVTVSGKNLSTVSRVVVGSANAAFTRVSATQLRVVMPSHVAGAVPVTLVSAYGNSAARSYTYVASAPSTGPSESPSPQPGSVKTAPGTRTAAPSGGASSGSSIGTSTPAPSSPASTPTVTKSPSTSTSTSPGTSAGTSAGTSSSSAPAASTTPAAAAH